MFRSEHGWWFDRLHHGPIRGPFSGLRLLPLSGHRLSAIRKDQLHITHSTVNYAALLDRHVHVCAPVMYVETQLALTAMESAEPGLLGLKGAVAQGFGLQSMCQFAGVFFGPLGGGFVEYRFGWGVMSAALGALATFTAMPMLWLDEKEEHDDEERRPLFSC